MKNKTIKITLKSISESINDLALAAAKGFESVDKRFESIDKHFESVDKRFDNLESKMKNVEKTLSAQIVGLDNKIDDLNFHKVRDEVYVLTQRVAKVETKVRTKI